MRGFKFGWIKRVLIAVSFFSCLSILSLYQYELFLIKLKVTSERFLMEYLKIYQLEPPKNYVYKQKQRNLIKFNADYGPNSK